MVHKTMAATWVRVQSSEYSFASVYLNVWGYGRSEEKDEASRTNVGNTRAQRSFYNCLRLLFNSPQQHSVFFSLPNT